MKAAWRDRYGGPDVVYVRDIDKPVPGRDEVLVRVKAASVNRADLDGLYPRWKFVRLFLGLRAPRESNRRVGADVCGVVEAVGDEVTGFKPGDDVFSDLSAHGSGSFAEYVSAPERAFAAMPAGMSHEDAACLPHAAILAIHAFRGRGWRSVAAGDRVLVVGASGNVGPFAIQIAKWKGAEVTGVASGEKLDFVRSLGADHVIDYRTTDYTSPAEPYDWIVDVNAQRSVRHWHRALKPRGNYVTFAGTTAMLLKDAILGPIVSRRTGKRLRMGYVRPFLAEDVAELTQLAERGVLRPAIDRRYPLDEVADALRYVDQGHARGKVVVTPAVVPVDPTAEDQPVSSD